MRNRCLIQILLLITICNSCGRIKRAYRLTDFNYSKNSEWFGFSISKDDFINTCQDLSLGFDKINDSTFSSYIDPPSPENEFIYYRIYTKVVVKEQSKLTKIKILYIDTIEYLDNSRKGKKIALNITQNECLELFENVFIKKIEVPIRNAVRLDTLYLKGLDFYSQNRLDIAFEYFDTVTNIRIREDRMFDYPQYSAYNRMGYIKLRQNNYTDAIKYFDLAFTIEPWWLRYSNRTLFRTNGKLPYWVKDNYLDELKGEYKYNNIKTYQLLIHANKAYALYCIDSNKIAKKYLNIAVVMYNNETNTKIVTGIDFYKQGNYYQAVMAFEKINNEDDMLDYKYFLEEATRK